MKHLARKSARKSGFGKARVPVVAVANQHRTVVVLVFVGFDVVSAVVVARYGQYFGVELNVRPHSKVIHVAFKILDNVAVVRKHGVFVGHREVGVGHHHAVGVDVQRPIGRRHSVVVVVAPIAADIGAFFKTIEGYSAFFQTFCGRNSRRTRADNADFHNFNA